MLRSLSSPSCYVLYKKAPHYAMLFIKKLTIVLCYLAFRRFLPKREMFSKCSPQYTALKPPQFVLYLNIRGQVSHLHKTRNNTTSHTDSFYIYR